MLSASTGRSSPTEQRCGGRWSHRKKGECVRSRYVIRQLRSQFERDGFAGTPGVVAVRLLMIIASLLHSVLVPGDFSVAFMHTRR